MEYHMSQKRFRFMFSIYFIIFGIAITLFSAFIGYKLQMVSIDENMEKNAQEIAYIKKNITLTPLVEKVNMLVLALAKNNSLDAYIKNSNAVEKKNLENLFLTIAMTDQKIMQVRYIDEKGMEIIRVDRLNSLDKPFIIEENKLQDKSSRNYFSAIKNMPKNTIWHSEIDLNIENGKIEVPFKPTMRVGSPLYDKETFKGMVIVNLLATEMLSSISKSTGFEHFVIDKEGNFILHPNEQYSFSKYTNSNRKIYDDFPLDASNIIKGDFKGEEFYAFSLSEILKNEDKAILVLKPKSSYLNALATANTKTTFYVLLLSILISIPLAMYASIVPSKLQKALISSNDELKRFAEIIDKYVITATTKKNSIITSISQAFVKVSGYEKEELLGKKINLLKHEDTPKEVYTDLWRTIEEGKKWFGLIKNKKKDETPYWLEQNIIPLKNEQGEIVSYMSVGVDITAQKELERISITDKLTNIFNRRKLDEELASEYVRAVRYEQNLSVLLMDIDYFKKVNDTYGHQTGDYVLQTLAKILKQNVRNSDILGRYGGEEFMIICPQTNENEALLLAEKLRSSVEAFVFDEVNNITISIGISQLSAQSNAKEMVKIADKALYEAKAKGRNCCVIGA
jgi:diguanylate cyclase (GGDEF)-like protein/PAS domain S-box-containing protein